MNLEQFRRNHSIPEEIALEEASCPLAPDAEDRTILEAPDRLYDGPGVWRIVRNRRSGLILTTPRPDLASIGRYYPAEYGPFRKPAQRKYRFRVLRLFQEWLSTYHLPPLAPGRMLEIGCATGTFLALMDEKGWQVEGLEPNESAAAQAVQQGFKVQVGQIETAPEPEDGYDLIVGWMVLEHLHQPLDILRTLNGWGREGARLALSMPNWASLDRLLFGRYWYAMQLPTHLTHFTPGTITALLAAAGWRVERIHHHRTLANYFGSLGIWLEATGLSRGWGKSLKTLPSRFPRWLATLLIPLSILAGLMGQTGRMTVIAVKDEA